MKKYLLAALGLLASLAMSVFAGKSREQTQQARRDKRAQQKVTEVYRDSEQEFNKDVADGRTGDARDHFS